MLNAYKKEKIKKIADTPPTGKWTGRSAYETLNLGYCR